MLHLVGYRDKTPEDGQQMRIAEARYLSEYGWDASFRGGCGDGNQADLDQEQVPDGAKRP
jgi:hypothetical protein